MLTLRCARFLGYSFGARGTNKTIFLFIGAVVLVGQVGCAGPGCRANPIVSTPGLLGNRPVSFYSPAESLQLTGLGDSLFFPETVRSVTPSFTDLV